MLMGGFASTLALRAGLPALVWSPPLYLYNVGQLFHPVTHMYVNAFHLIVVFVSESISTVYVKEMSNTNASVLYYGHVSPGTSIRRPQ